MHVRGFTRHPSSASARRRAARIAGLIEKIPYLQELGITAVELLPVFQFDAQDCPPGQVNYWGYAPVSFFAPHHGVQLAARPARPGGRVSRHGEGLHRAGIEVILDVVFNHTAEGDRTGPTLSFRGIDNPTYYILEDGGSPLRQLHRLRQHAQRQSPDRPPDDRGQPALLGARNARRRLPLRPGVDPVPRRLRAIRCRIRRCSGTSSRTRPSRAPS